MRARRIYAVVLRQFFLMRGSYSRIVPLFAWVTVDIVLWGFISEYLNTITRAGLKVGATILGAVLLWDFFMRAMQGVSMAFFEDVWSRNFLNFFASPLSIGEYLAGLVISSLLTSTFGLGVMLLLADTVFGLSFLSIGLMLIPFLLILSLFGMSLGIMACAMVLRLGPASEWFVWPIPALIVPFAGVYYPVSTLPRWMQLVAQTLPPAYLFENFRAVWAGQAVSWGSLALGLFLTLVYVFAAFGVFIRTYGYALQTGLIARYSAESVS